MVCSCKLPQRILKALNIIANVKLKIMTLKKCIVAPVHTMQA
jgi:hypothetical protein